MQSLPYHRVRTMTAAHMRDYCVALETAVARSARPVTVGNNIHTDDLVARAHGLPRRVADGMIIANWLHQAVLEVVGIRFLQRGSFEAKFIRPVFVDDVVRLSIERDDRPGSGAASDRVMLLLAAEKAGGELCTVGTAAFPAEFLRDAPVAGIA